MMPNITRGGRTPGLMAYLVGPKQVGGNLHVDPHLVAGDENVTAWHEGQTLTAHNARQIAYMLDQPMQTFGTRVSVPVRRKNADGELIAPSPIAQREHEGPDGQRMLVDVPAAADVKDAHVWHCSLSLRAEEGTLSDQTWAQISREFVAKLDFADPDSPKAPCRWIALRHGLSGGGNDHVHIVVNLVREDGTKANTWNDRPRAQRAASELEQAHGLQVLESRVVGRGARESTPAERGIADRREARQPPEQRTGQTAREQLERIVRASAAASQDEAEFVRRVVRSGVRIRPRFADGRTDIVSGYSVALRGDVGQAPDWYGGGRLARDLTLPRLRAGWGDSTPQSASAAVAEWTRARRDEHPGHAHPEEMDPRAWLKGTEQVRVLREKLRAVDPDDHATWAHVAHETAGAFAAWSMQVEPTPGPLAETAQALARSGQLRAHQVRPKPVELPSAKGAARLLASLAHGGQGPVAQAALLVQLANTARALHDAHRAAGDARRAQEIARAVRTQLAEVADRLPSPDAVAASITIDPAARKAARDAQRRTSSTPTSTAPRTPQPPVRPAKPTRDPGLDR